MTYAIFSLSSHQFLAKQLLHDAMFYVNPLMSMYIFGSWMHCVWSSSVRLAPVYFVGFLILLLLDGYVRNCADGTRNSGYTSVSLPEILRAIVSTGQGRHMHHLSTEKRPIRGADDPSLVMEPYDHLEFPFSEGNEYKKRTIEETLVKGGTGNRRDKQKGKISEAWETSQTSISRDSNSFFQSRTAASRASVDLSETGEFLE